MPQSTVKEKRPLLSQAEDASKKQIIMHRVRDFFYQSSSVSIFVWMLL